MPAFRRNSRPRALQIHLLAAVIASSAAGLLAQSADAQSSEVAASPCLQHLNEQKANPPPPEEPKAPNWFSKNAEKLMGAGGAVLGAVVGKSVCKNSQAGNCVAIGAVGGAFLGSQLGKMLSEADQKRYKEATYKVGLTGRPQSLTFDNGCAVVEAASTETFEDRQVELAFGPGVATPQKLRAVAEPYVRPTSSNVGTSPADSKGAIKVGANVPSFVMGSTESGKYLLLGREDADQGFVGTGYVNSQGWVASPDATPVAVASAAGESKLVKLGVEVPCRQISSSIRVEATNKTETVPGKVCRLPNGISETQ